MSKPEQIVFHITPQQCLGVSGEASARITKTALRRVAASYIGKAVRDYAGEAVGEVTEATMSGGGIELTVALRRKIIDIDNGYSVGPISMYPAPLTDDVE